MNEFDESCIRPAPHPGLGDFLSMREGLANPNLGMGQPLLRGLEPQ